MEKKALCVGINDYPGTNNDLSGCVNDAQDWAELLKSIFGFGDNISMLLNKEATKKNILTELTKLISNSSEGDILAFTYSGHGTWVPDNEDHDEVDNRDEAICAYDETVLDDEIREVIRKINSNAHLTVISDSCFSGGVTRIMLGRSAMADVHTPKPRFMPPKEPGGNQFKPIRRRAFYPESDMPEILITGCNSTEYSYDASINGKFNGAMTANAIDLIRQNQNQTYRDLHNKLRTRLPSSQWPQSPQLEGSDGNKNRQLFN
jgi:hypothetical protein